MLSPKHQGSFKRYSSCGPEHGGTQSAEGTVSATSAALHKALLGQVTLNSNVRSEKSSGYNNMQQSRVGRS